MPSPRVTVFIPVFNAQAYLAEAIDSILAQTFADFELLLIDDGSTDATPAIIESYAAESRLRTITHESNRGQVVTRNEGVDLACGDYIALMDADDLSMPERLARQVQFLDAHPEIAVLGTWVQKIDHRGKERARDKGRRPCRWDELACHMLFYCALYNTSVMVRARVMKQYRYRAAFMVATDYDFWMRILAQHRFATLPRRLAAYRAHAGQMTAEKADMLKRNMQIIFARQFIEMGVEYTAVDLERHYQLSFGGRAFSRVAGHELDLTYLRWARDWLELLLSANKQTHVFPEPAFSRLVGDSWLSLCRKTARYSGLEAWQVFWHSRLRWTALAALCRSPLVLRR